MPQRPTLESRPYVFDPRPKYPFQITAKRYWSPESKSNSPEALTLIFAHGTGFSKEHWEPTLEHIYELLSQSNLNILEAWSIDCPNHGDAAVLNEEALQMGYRWVGHFGWEEYARSIHSFLTGLGTGVDVDFTKRRLVGIGHSMGAVALMLAGTFFPEFKFESLILVDPMLFPMPKPGESMIDLATGAARRRDIWPSREEALRTLQSRASFKVWDPRVLSIFVEHGLRDLPTLDYPDTKEGITLKCSKYQEAACYRDIPGILRGYKYLAPLCEAMPVHFIYGAIDDYLPRQIKEHVLTVATKGKHASVARVPGAGHLVPQMQPKRLAEAIYVVLKASGIQGSASSGETVRSKL